MEEDNRIYKYTLDVTDHQIIRLPKEAVILSVINQGADIVLYALVNTKETQKCTFAIEIIGTGHKVPEQIEAFNFIGTVGIHNNSYVFHVFCRLIQG